MTKVGFAETHKQGNKVGAALNKFLNERILGISVERWPASIVETLKNFS